MVTYELLVIEGSGSVDRVLVVKSSEVDEQTLIDDATDFGDLRGEVFIAERIPLTEAQANALDTSRPYMG